MNADDPEAGRFDVEVVPDRERVIVVPHGEVDLSTVDRVRARLDELQEAGFTSLVLDLRKVTFIDSTGLRLVVEEIQNQSIEFAVVPGNETVQRVFEVTGLLDVVPFIPATEAPKSNG